MREIKYRVWNIRENRWANHNEQLSEIPVSASVNTPSILTIGSDNYVLQLFTGLKDSLDKEIYEGDILCDCLNEKSYEVIWDDYGMFLFRPIGVDEREHHPIDNYDLDEVKSHASTIVVGNIYENPELLEDNQ